MVQSFGSLSTTSWGGAIFAASALTAPKVVLRPDGPWVITPRSTRHSASGTPQPFAAAATSIIRAAAPPLRTYSWESRTPRLPPVE